MSSFSIPPLSGSIKFDVSQFTGAVSQVNAGAQNMGQAIAQHVDGAAEHAGHSVSAISEGVFKGMIESQAALSLFPPMMVELFENPVMGAAGIGVEAIEKFAELSIEAVKKLVEELDEVAGEFHHIDVEAKKVGVTMEFLENLTRAGKEVEVSEEQIANGLKMLGIRASEATQGSEEAAKGFNALGISTAWLNKHLDDNQAIANEVMKKIGGLANETDRLSAARAVMGRGGSDIALVLGMSANEMDRLYESAKRFGATAPEGAEKSAQAFVSLKNDWHDMIEGMENRLTIPLMQYIEEHGPEIKETMLEFSDAVGTLLPDAIETAKPLLDSLTTAMHDLTDEIRSDTGSLKEWIHEADDLAKRIRLIVDSVSTLRHMYKAGEALVNFNIPEAAMQIRQTAQSAENVGRDFHSVFDVNVEMDANKYGESAGKAVAKQVDRHLTEQGHLIRGVRVHANVARGLGGRY